MPIFFESLGILIYNVRDDQTTVQINLYRSETGNMVDADYVDTLLIDNLVPHPKEEPSFKLVLKLDENNMLSAEIDDPETGEKSDIKVSLVNMGSKSIFDEPDYKLSSEEQSETGNIPAESTRRLIHTTLNDIGDVETKSEGEGLYKQVRVIYKGLR